MTPSGAAETILVTGATGFVGQAVCRGLHATGLTVIPIDVADRVDVPGLVQTDLRDRTALRSLLENARPATVVHCAAYGRGDSGLLESARLDTAEAIDVNVVAFKSLLEESRKAGVKRIVWTSSTTVYGPSRCYGSTERVDEASPTAPVSTYGATKMLAEQIATSFFSEAVFEPVALRLPLVYGPGRWYGGAQRRWMALLKLAAKRKEGTYELDASPADWLYISDASDAIITAVQQGRFSQPVFNVPGLTTSEAEMGQLVVSTTRAPITIIPVEGPSFVPLVDGTAFSRTTSWKPSVNLAQGATALIEAIAAEGGP